MNRLIYCLLLALVLVSCKEKDKPEEPGNGIVVDKKGVKHTVLVYAINRSSLSYDFIDDSNEMLDAMETVDLNKYQLLVYRTDSKTKCGLYSVNVSDKTSKPEFSLVKEYDREKTSTDPERISEVMKYALSLFPNSTYDLVFWGHGMSWKPYFTDHTLVSEEYEYSFGGEHNGGYDSEGHPLTDWTEIDDLAACVPDNTFNTVWFDCCYMTGIEVIYEFRNKCRTFVGYPSEVWQYGLAYDRMLPYLMSEKHDIVGAARSFYEYYSATDDPVTVAVIDMAGLEAVADVAKSILSSGAERPVPGSLLNYSRVPSSPFYDFRQYMCDIADLNGQSSLSNLLRQKLDQMVIYHAESSKNFNLRDWDTSNISGISTHFYLGSNLMDEKYYRTLAWFKRVYTD